jgi:hypothetical protein
MNKADFLNTKIGDKLIFNGSGPHWFLNRVENAKKFVKGQIYTIKNISVASSSTAAEFEEVEGEVELGWFDKNE